MRNVCRIAGVILLIQLIHACNNKDEVPTLATNAVSNITRTTATSGGNITSEGSGTVVERGVCWSKGITPTLSDNRTIEGGGAGTFISNMTDLDAGSTYYVRAYAKNEAGTGYGMAMSFTTLGQLPLAITQAATNVTEADAKLNATVNANYVPTIITFEYGPTTAYGSSIAAIPSSVTGGNTTSVSVNISGLTSGKTYHFRIKAVSSVGTTYGNDQSFITTMIDPNNITFDVSIAVPFAVNETAINNSGKTYTESKLLNAASDPEIAKYESKIKEIKVNRITYTISNANPNTVTFTNGTIKIVATSKQIASVAFINLTSTTETDLITDTSGLNELAAKLLDDKQEMMQLQGVLSKTPVTFNVNFKFYLTIKASAL